VGEVCFNTAMTGYQEIMTDPSYAGADHHLHFPAYRQCRRQRHRGVNPPRRARCGCVVREDVTDPSNFRSRQPFRRVAEGKGHHRHFRGRHPRADPLIRWPVPRMRSSRMIHAVSSTFRPCSSARAAGPGWRAWTCAAIVTAAPDEEWDEGTWTLGKRAMPGHRAIPGSPHVVAIDYGVKRNILRSLVQAGARVTVVPAQTAARCDILAPEARRRVPLQRPRRSGGDRQYAVPVIKGLLERKTFRPSASASATRCSALAAGAKTAKMHQGHRGANHPVKRLSDGVVEITSMNHGFAVDNSTPAGERWRKPTSRCSTARTAAWR
jgi:carbamoyl-phosphate synthase small subunit